MPETPVASIIVMFSNDAVTALIVIEPLQTSFSFANGSAPSIVNVAPSTNVTVAVSKDVGSSGASFHVRSESDTSAASDEAVKNFDSILDVPVLMICIAKRPPRTASPVPLVPCVSRLTSSERSGMTITSTPSPPFAVAVTPQFEEAVTPSPEMSSLFASYE